MYWFSEFFSRLIYHMFASDRCSPILLRISSDVSFPLLFLITFHIDSCFDLFNGLNNVQLLSTLNIFFNLMELLLFYLCMFLSHIKRSISPNLLINQFIINQGREIITTILSITLDFALY